MNADLSQVTVLSGILITNLAAAVGFFVSLKVSVAVLKVEIKNLKRDVNNLGNLYRGKNTQTEPEKEEE